MQPHSRIEEFVERSQHCSLPLCAPLPINVVPDYLTQDEHDLLEQQATIKLKRLLGREGYREAHSDSVIVGYKEAMISAWVAQRTAPTDAAQRRTIEIIERIKSDAEKWLGLAGDGHENKHDESIQWQPPHVLDLRGFNSGIGAHVDSVAASGRVIAGVCLISPAVLVFRSTQDPERDYFRVLVPPRCLYMQADRVRFDFTHEIPHTEDPAHSFKGQFIQRDRRISIMVRDKPLVSI